MSHVLLVFAIRAKLHNLVKNFFRDLGKRELFVCLLFIFFFLFFIGHTLSCIVYIRFPLNRSSLAGQSCPIMGKPNGPISADF
jgi:hypothetical protein